MRRLVGYMVSGLVAAAHPAMAADDPFHWLENRNGERAIEWVDGQNRKTTEAFTADPRFDAYFEQALELFTAEDNIAAGAADHGVVYNFWQDGKNPLGIWRRTSIESYKTASPAWESLIDFDQLAAMEGTNWVFFGAECTDPPQSRCLVNLSPDGGDAVEVREFDLDSKAFVEDGFFSPISKSSMYWAGRDAVIVSAAYTDAELTTSGYPRVVKLLERGQKPEDARAVLEASIEHLSASGYAIRDGNQTYLVASKDIDFYTAEEYLIRPGGSLVRMPLPPGLAMGTVFKSQYVFSPRNEWTTPAGEIAKPGGLYAFDFAKWAETGVFGSLATVHEPHDRVALSTLAATRDRLFVVLLDNVRGRVVAKDFDGSQWTSTLVDLPDNGDVTINHADPFGTSVSFNFQDFLTPPSILWSDDDGRTLQTIKTLTPRFDASRYESQQFEAVSEDGTPVPYFVVRSKNQAKPVPTLLYGYGGFESSMTPWYSSGRGKFWLEQGNAFVLANIRGGGEFGAEWHQAALKENRQRAYDDMAAIAEDLVERGITTAKQLGVQGGSNGGLLAGVMLTQRPDLFGAVISDVPLLDMLRYAELPPGASWIAEYGDPAIPDEAEFIAKYSPYQNVKPDVTYPPVLFTTSTADDRVHPGHARKMAALLQSLGQEAYFHENTEGGHGGNGDPAPQAFVYALQYIFLQRMLEGTDNHPAATAMDRSVVDADYNKATTAGESERDRFGSRSVQDQWLGEGTRRLPPAP